MRVYLTEAAALRPFYERALPLLPPGRRRKTLALTHEDDRLRSLAAGLLLRRFVGGGECVLGDFGKPSLPGAACFSLSHGGALSVLAVGGAELGVDVEPCARPWREAVAERVLQPHELTALRYDGSLFLPLWTRKEAVLKCAGLGLARSPAAFSVWPEDCCELDGARYALCTLPYDGYVLSLASLSPFPPPELCPVEAAELLL